MPGFTVRNRWILIGVGFLVELVLGLVYAWSVFVLPLEREFGWARAQTSLAFTVSLILFPVGMLAVGPLLDRQRLRLAGSLGAVLLGSGFLLTSFTHSIPWLLVSYGILCGLSIGALANAVMSILGWFPDRRGLATGIMSMGFGLGALLLGSLADRLIAEAGWRTAFRLLAVVSFAVCMGGFQILRQSPPGWSPPGWQPPVGPSHALAGRDYQPAEMLRTRAFWLVEIWFVLTATAGVMVIGHVVPLAVELGLDQVRAVLAMGILSLANGLGRPLYGTVSDRLGRPLTMFLVSLLMSVALLLAIPLAQTLGYLGLMAAVLFVGSSYGGTTPLFVVSTLQLFGPRRFGTNLAIGSFQLVVSSLLGPQLAGLLRSNTGTYDLPFVVIGLLTLGACLAALRFGWGLRRQTHTTRSRG